MKTYSHLSLNLDFETQTIEFGRQFLFAPLETITIQKFCSANKYFVIMDGKTELIEEIENYIYNEHFYKLRKNIKRL